MINTILFLLAAALFSVGLVQYLRLSPIIGFFLAGIVLGPHGAGVVAESQAIHQIGEFGIVFLMFTIGLEFSLSRLLADRFLVLALGGLQVLLSATAFALLAYFAQIPLFAAITLGVALSMSSTAIVSRLLIEGAEVNSIYGRTAICILLFQDLATIIFLMLMPVMSGGSFLSQASELTAALVKGAAVFFALLFVGRLIIRPSFQYIASRHSSELFMLAVLVASVGAAKFAQMMGLSLALGGFMAGMVLGETKFRHQVEADIRPFQDVLLGLFFITIGMLVDWEIVARIWPAVLAVTAGLILLKATLVFALTRVMGVATATAIRTGISLAHGGEFSLMLLFLALQMGMLQAEAGQIILITVLLSMVMAPILIRYSTPFSERLSGASLQRTQQGFVNNIETAAENLSAHVILCGYGRVGQNVAWFLDEENVEYVAVDLELNRLHETVEAGQRVTYGDTTQRHILAAAGIDRAQAIVITFDDVRGTLKTLSQVHELRPDITVIVRATDEQHLHELLDAGATEVIPDTLETSLTMAAHVLTLLGVPVATVAERSDRMRADRYRLLRGVFHGRDQVHHRDRIRAITILSGSYAVGRSLRELQLVEHRIRVTAIRRHGIRGTDPAPEIRLQPQDVLIVHGSPEALAHVERYLANGDAAS